MSQSRAASRVLKNVGIQVMRSSSIFYRMNSTLSRNMISNKGCYRPRYSMRFLSAFKDEYDGAAAERAALGVVPKALDAEGVSKLVELLKNPPKGEDAFLLNLLKNCIPPGVDEAAYVKAAFLTAVAKKETTSPLVSAELATELLGTMVGGYNIASLVQLLDDEKLAPIAAKGLKNTLLMFDAFHDVETKAQGGNKIASEVIKSWAEAEWFLSKPEVPKKITVTVFKVPGETNTDDLSPAPDAWSRPDIPLHALAMLKHPRPGKLNLFCFGSFRIVTCHYVTMNFLRH
jgi:aconitate hydratase 2/2-methylisocitrate dehydratase